MRNARWQKYIFRFLAAWLTCWFINACATHSLESNKPLQEEPVPIVYYETFGKAIDIKKSGELFQLSQKQRTTFLKYYEHPSNWGKPGHQKLANYLKTFARKFNFYSDTLIPTEAFAQQQGNCLSLAMLTTALARIGNIDIGYELMHTPPVYQKRGNTILKSQHVRSVLYPPDATEMEGVLFLLKPVIKIDYFSTPGGHVRKRVSERDFIAMYYRNVAAEALINNRLKDAYWLILESYQYAEKDSHATNILALIYEKSGFDQDAENLYLYGIKYSDEKLELLSNYHKFLIRKKRYKEANEVKQQIAEFDEPNPFDWLDMADDALAMREYNEAIRYYEKVIELAPYLHHGYFGRGKVEYLQGFVGKANRSFAKAKELTWDKETQALYQSELAALKSGDFERSLTN